MSTEHVPMTTEEITLSVDRVIDEMYRRGMDNSKIVAFMTARLHLAPAAVLSPPSNFNASAGDTRVSLSWTASSSIGVTGVGVYLGASLIATVPVGTTVYDVTGLTNGTAYTFALDAEVNGRRSLQTAAKLVTPIAELAPSSNPTGVPYEVVPSFNASTAYSVLGKSIRDAMIQGAKEAAAGSLILKPELGGGDTKTQGHEHIVNIYKLRGNKRYTNVIRGIIRLKGDPGFIPAIYNSIKVVLDKGFRTNWIEWPSSVSFPPDWIHASSAEVAAGDKYKSEMWRNNKGKEYPQYKKLLYMHWNTVFDGTISNRAAHYYGTNLHALDNILGHSFVFWSGYILDVNKTLAGTTEEKAQYKAAADTLWDYYENHWRPNMEAMYGRHPDYGFFESTSALHHNVAANASVYECLELWEKFRKGAARSETVKARKHLQWAVRQNLNVYPVPSGYSLVANPTQYKFVNQGHQNHHYKHMISDWYGVNKVGGAADTTYDSEFGSEFMNFYLNGTEDIDGNKFQRSTMEAYSNTHGMVIQRRQSSSTYDPNVAENISAVWYPSGYSGTRYTRFNNGSYAESRDGGSNGSDWPRYTQFRRVNGNLTGHEGQLMYGMLCGWSMWADPTPERYNMKQWLTRMAYNYQTDMRLRVSDVAKGHTSTSLTEAKKSAMKKTYDWMGPLLIATILRPEINFETISVPTLDTI